MHVSLSGRHFSKFIDGKADETDSPRLRLVLWRVLVRAPKGEAETQRRHGKQN